MPCDPTTIERLNALEHAVVELRRDRQSKTNSTEPWWKSIVGSCAGIPGFDEAMEYGRRIRKGEMKVPDLPCEP